MSVRSNPELPVAVIGAGIVGMATARALQRSGRSVVVFDPSGPGRKTSYGNAGFVAIDHILPLARPDVLLRVPRMLLDRTSPLTIHPASLPFLVPWMLRFAAAAISPREVGAGVACLSELLRDANRTWQSEIQYSGLGELFRTQGALYVFETERGFQAGAAERAAQKDAGLRFEIIDGHRAREIAPGLTDRIVRGVYFPDGMHTVDPYRVVVVLAERFAAEGGRIERSAVRGFTLDGDDRSRVAAVDTDAGPVPVSGAVIAAGRASGELTRQLGFSAPLVAERGYHVMLTGIDARFALPVSPVERGFFITPMQEGLRVVGTVELAAPDRPETWSRADILLRHLEEIFPGLGGREVSRWMGERPTLPDFRPAIGQAPHHDNVWCAYGHQHVGLTLAAVTARHIVSLVDGEQLPPALAPCDPGRFG